MAADYDQLQVAATTLLKLPTKVMTAMSENNSFVCMYTVNSDTIEMEKKMSTIKQTVHIGLRHRSSAHLH